MPRLGAPLAALIWPVLLALASALLFVVAAGLDEIHWPVLWAAAAWLLAVGAGVAGGALVGSAATALAFLALGFYLGARYPSIPFCLDDCGQRTETFGATADPVWMLGLVLAASAAWGAVLRTPYRLAAMYFALIVLSLLGVGWNAAAPERWHELTGLLVPAGLAFGLVLFTLEVRRVGVRRRQLEQQSPEPSPD